MLKKNQVQDKNHNYHYINGEKWILIFIISRFFFPSIKVIIEDIKDNKSCLFFCQTMRYLERIPTYVEDTFKSYRIQTNPDSSQDRSQGR